MPFDLPDPASLIDPDVQPVKVGPPALPDPAQMSAAEGAKADALAKRLQQQVEAERYQYTQAQKTHTGGGPEAYVQTPSLDAYGHMNEAQLQNLAHTQAGLPSTLPQRGIMGAMADDLTGSLKQTGSGLAEFMGGQAFGGRDAVAREQEANAANFAPRTFGENFFGGLAASAPTVAGIGVTKGRSLQTLLPRSLTVPGEITAASLVQNMADKNQTPPEAILNAGLEGATTWMGGAFEPLQRALKGLSNKQIAKELLLKEPAEGALAGFSQDVVSQTLGNNQDPFSLERALKAGGAGGLSEGAMGVAISAPGQLARAVPDIAAQFKSDFDTPAAPEATAPASALPDPAELDQLWGGIPDVPAEQADQAITPPPEGELSPEDVANLRMPEPPPASPNPERLAAEALLPEPQLDPLQAEFDNRKQAEALGRLGRADQSAGDTQDVSNLETADLPFVEPKLAPQDPGTVPDLTAVPGQMPRAEAELRKGGFATREDIAQRALAKPSDPNAATQQVEPITTPEDAISNAETQAIEPMKPGFGRVRYGEDGNFQVEHPSMMELPDQTPRGQVSEISGSETQTDLRNIETQADLEPVAAGPDTSFLPQDAQAALAALPPEIRNHPDMVKTVESRRTANDAVGDKGNIQQVAIMIKGSMDRAAKRAAIAAKNAPTQPITPVSEPAQAQPEVPAAEATETAPAEAPTPAAEAPAASQAVPPTADTPGEIAATQDDDTGMPHAPGHRVDKQARYALQGRDAVTRDAETQRRNEKPHVPIRQSRALVSREAREELDADPEGVRARIDAKLDDPLGVLSNREVDQAAEILAELGRKGDENATALFQQRWMHARTRAGQALEALNDRLNNSPELRYAHALGQAISATPVQARPIQALRQQVADLEAKLRRIQTEKKAKAAEGRQTKIPPKEQTPSPKTGRSEKRAGFEAEKQAILKRLRRVLGGQGGMSALGGEAAQVFYEYLENRVKAGVFKFADMVQDVFQNIPGAKSNKDIHESLEQGWEVVRGLDARLDEAQSIARILGEKKAEGQPKRLERARGKREDALEGKPPPKRVEPELTPEEKNLEAKIQILLKQAQRYRGAVKELDAAEKGEVKAPKPEKKLSEEDQAVEDKIVALQKKARELRKAARDEANRPAKEARQKARLEERAARKQARTEARAARKASRPERQIKAKLEAARKALAEAKLGKVGPGKKHLAPTEIEAEIQDLQKQAAELRKAARAQLNSPRPAKYTPQEEAERAEAKKNRLEARRLEDAIKALEAAKRGETTPGKQQTAPTAIDAQIRDLRKQASDLRKANRGMAPPLLESNAERKIQRDIEKLKARIEDLLKKNNAVTKELRAYLKAQGFDLDDQNAEWTKKPGGLQDFEMALAAGRRGIGEAALLGGFVGMLHGTFSTVVTGGADILRFGQDMARRHLQWIGRGGPLNSGVNAEFTAYWKAMIPAMMHATANFAKTLYNERSSLPYHDTAEYHIFPSRATQKLGKLGTAARHITLLPTARAIDAGLKTLAAELDVVVEAQKSAVDSNGKRLKGEALEQHLAREMKMGSESWAHAAAHAARQTFTMQPMQPFQWLGSLRTSGSLLERAAATSMFPFLHTASNAFRVLMRDEIPGISDVIMATKALRVDPKTGLRGISKMDVSREVAQAVLRWGMLMGIGALMGMEDDEGNKILTGYAPDEIVPVGGDRFRQAPHAVRIDGHSIDLNRLSILGPVLGLGVDLWNGKLLQGLKRVVQAQPAVEPVIEVAKAIDRGESAPDAWAKFVADKIPILGMVTAYGRASDPMMRDPYAEGKLQKKAEKRGQEPVGFVDNLLHHLHGRVDPSIYPEKKVRGKPMEKDSFDAFSEGAMTFYRMLGAAQLMPPPEYYQAQTGAPKKPKPQPAPTP